VIEWDQSLTIAGELTDGINEDYQGPKKALSGPGFVAGDWLLRPKRTNGPVSTGMGSEWPHSQQRPTTILLIVGARR
jgi:hypothetical protein